MSTSDRTGLAGLRWLLLSLAIVVLDQWTKSIATASLQLHQSVDVFTGLKWTLAHNYGVAFSLFNDGDGWQRFVLSGFAIVVACGFVFMLTRQPRADKATKLAFALVIGGAFGNVIDRIRFGYVVDFIDVYWRDSHWPAFNIADSSICIAAVVLLLWGWKHERAASVAAVKER